MNILYNELKENEVTEDGEITKGDNLLNQFYCGNWSASVKEMIEQNISATDLINYIENEESQMGKSEYLNSFDRAFFVELGMAGVRFN